MKIKKMFLYYNCKMILFELNVVQIVEKIIKQIIFFITIIIKKFYSKCREELYKNKNFL